MGRGSSVIGFRSNSHSVCTRPKSTLMFNACGECAINIFRDTLAQPYAALTEKALATMSVSLSSPLYLQPQSSFER